MGDWPSTLINPPNGLVQSIRCLAALTFDAALITAMNATTGGTWPAANRALYIPFMVETTVTAYQMAFQVTVQSGNCDVGIYDQLGNRLVSKGSTAVAAAGLQVIDITDTELNPGVYYMALNIDNTTAAVQRGTTCTALQLQVCGMQQQAVGAVTLPNPATFANPASAYTPQMVVALKSTI